MAAALRSATPGDAYRGWHTCSCGAMSDNVTNSLAVHYLARHRGEVPPEDVAAARMMPHWPVEPTTEEVEGRRRARRLGR